MADLSNYVASPLVFWVYLLGYLFLTAACVGFFTPLIRQTWTSDLAALLSKAHAPVFRFAALVLFASLAGLPPFFFFFCKLAALAAVASQGLWAVLGGLLSLLFLSWYAYQGALARAASYTVAAQKRPLLLSAKDGLSFCALMALLMGAAFFLDDLILLASWLAQF